MALMGVDVGTSGVKAVAFGRGGQVLASAYEAYPLRFPFPGAAELDSKRVVDASLRVISTVARQARDSDPVEAIGIASQGEAFTPVGPDGAYLGNGMTSSDSRASSLAETWAVRFGRERLYRITGHTANPMFSVFKLLWLRENRPQTWLGAWRFLFYQDLVAYALTGATATDPSMAARSMLYDVGRRQWSSEILGDIGLCEDKLPTVVPSGSVVGTVGGDVAQHTGLSAGVGVCVCGHDQPVGGLGAGAIRPGIASYSVGTVECICPCTDRMLLRPEMMNANLATYPHVAGGCYTTVAYNTTGGCVIRWVLDELMPELKGQAADMGRDPYDHLIAQASGIPAKVLVLPHWGPTGTPHFDPYGAGTIFGLKLSTSRGELIQAFLEGSTYEMKLNLCVLQAAGLDLTELRAVGGGARSDLWMQIKADILGRPICTVRVSEATCMGAAMLAGQGAGLHSVDEVAGQWASPRRHFQPRHELGRQYEQRFAMYREIYGALRQARHMLSELEEEA